MPGRGRTAPGGLRRRCPAAFQRRARTCARYSQPAGVGGQRTRYGAQASVAAVQRESRASAGLRAARQRRLLGGARGAAREQQAQQQRGRHAGSSGYHAPDNRRRARRVAGRQPTTPTRQPRSAAHRSLAALPLAGPIAAARGLRQPATAAPPLPPSNRWRAGPLASRRGRGRCGDVRRFGRCYRTPRGILQ